MTDETLLACSANHTYREGYDQGKEDAFEESDEFIEMICKNLRENEQELREIEDVIGLICDLSQGWQTWR